MHPLTGKVLAAYIRVSKGEQQEGGVERQRSTLESWASLHGLFIAHWFIDDEGRNPRDLPEKRRQFQRLLKAIEAGSIDAVLVDAQDRFGVGDAFELGRYVTLLRDHDCELWSAADGLISGADEGTVIRSTVGAMQSRREQLDKANRSVTTRKRLAEAGEYVGGYPPYGCDVVCFDAAGRPKWRVVSALENKIDSTAFSSSELADI